MLLIKCPLIYSIVYISHKCNASGRLTLLFIVGILLQPYLAIAGILLQPYLATVGVTALLSYHRKPVTILPSCRNLFVMLYLCTHLFISCQK